MQPMTPEQVAKQKVDMKAGEMQQARSLRENPGQLSPMDALREALMPQRPKLKPKPTMKVFSKNGELFGAGKVSKGK